MLVTQRQSPFIFADRLRLPVAFDPAGLRDDLERIAGATWVDHFVKQNYEGDWSVLPLRYSAGATHPIMQAYSDPTVTAFDESPLLDHAPHIRGAMAWFQCPLQTVRLMRLTPGSIIKEHFDHDLAAEWGTARIHIPITTNPQVEFMVNREPVAMDPGSAWYLRLSDPHSVANRGTTDRVHLVVDCTANDWLAEQLAAGT
ncbi:MAG: aspartyl/asparaginyl beta-hydroxylase domain-containing protein [Candidatus Sphingomonas phytovorans]|nr:aspartyl/asparaginyl beta-hydroxylase domain-containing protein [Sphingomonas sp.]WEJ99708.1 MAG: aspartyl/asparaginyl beta-hydroxylase domain-containing protein [Sphingomonas sp.]